MPYTVPASFDKFIDNITITGDHKDTAESRRKRIVDLLHNDFDILDSFPTGSIPKGTALKSHADLDIIIVLHWAKHIKDKLPSQVLAAVQSTLKEYKTGVRSNGQAVTLSYDSWPDVDIVPVSKTTNDDGTVKHYNVPDMNTESWIMSRPRAHAIAIAKRAKDCRTGFLPLIRMVKEWNRVHSELMSSYHLEVLALRACSGPLGDYPWALYDFFRQAALLAQAPLQYEDSYADASLDWSTRPEVVKRLETARDKASAAWYKTYGTNIDHAGAIELWRQMFGSRFPAYG